MNFLKNNLNSRKKQRDYDTLKSLLISLRHNGMKEGLSEEEILSIIKSKLQECRTQKKSSVCSRLFLNLNFALFVLILATITTAILNGKEFTLNRCIIENNYLVMEITRPITNCKICKDIDSFTVLENVTKGEFFKYAYLSHPLLVRGGCLNWTALDVFSYDFFKQLYTSTEGAYRSVEEECQFFPFRTSFLSLREVFNMSEERAKFSSANEKTWYIGWSNCNPDVSLVLRQHYSKPYFLPDDSELSAIDWIFMGYQGPGASMHLDYVRRPSWQAQIRGKKTWYLLPPPECEDVCSPMNITVNKGDIILVDTNQWYHTTVIEGEEMSITLGSEYD